MKRLATALAASCLLALLLLAPTARAHHPSLGNFGINGFDVVFTNEDDTPDTQAGSHPFAMTTTIDANLDAEDVPEGWLRNISFEEVPGLVGNTTAFPRCSNLEFAQEGANVVIPPCPLDTQVGIAATSLNGVGSWNTSPVFNLVPPPGALLRLGFSVETLDVIVDVGLGPDAPYLPTAASRNVLQVLNVLGNKTQLWGDPTSPAHDELRGECGLYEVAGLPADPAAFQFEGQGQSCPVLRNPRAFLTLPTDCSHPLLSSYEAVSWEGETDAGSRLIHDAAGNPQPLTGCGRLPFHPTITAQPTSKAAQSPTGLDFSLNIEDEGLTKATGLAQSNIRKVVVTLPKGMTINPSQAEGLEVCSESDLEDETLGAGPGEGCPQASKIGSVEVESPLVAEPVKGALFVAEPYRNLADDSLIAVYMVIKNPKLGIIVKQALKVEPDPVTGQLVTTADDIPQLPFSHFRLHFREGGRSPLVSPPLCGSYEAKAEITPWSGTAPIATNAVFQVALGPNEGPCPPGGTPPFDPGFQSGSQNNAAGAYAPFSMRFTRRDGDQDLTRFDATLPPGVVAKLAGVDKCPDAQIALAKTKTGIAELRSPSCPANSKIGSVIGGAGVGSQLTYVPGSVYLAGSFGGAPLSAVGIVPAVAGPFDVGTVVVRQALEINPRTGEVTADGAHSDPLPHILAGIPLTVRDIRVNIDRPDFTLNPTSCDPFATRAEIFGGGSNVFNAADDSPVGREARYQAASCTSLGFKPQLSLKLKGGTRRGAHPSLHAVLRPRSHDANISGTVVRLPHSAFLDQGHIRTICTRVQYAAKACPSGAAYGRVRAFSPLLSEPLQGPAYLRSSSHKLPDLVFSLHGLVDFEAVARLDSKKGGIRATFTGVPDVPIAKVVVDMQGGAKGLIVNSTNLCAAKHHANVQLDAHNGKQLTIAPLLAAKCTAGRR